MKVNNTSTPNADRTRNITGPGQTGAVTPTKERRSPQKAPDVDTGITENVAISTRAKDALKAKEIAQEAPDMDEAKINRLKAAIQNGAYKVDAERIADKLVDEHLFGGV